ncbi:hypothetical protein Ahy_A04g020818 [Arachis hypogaea]|uniref:SWIM-type domain-containing protein n=1 Tax=Arachis hypogaea TaxID=3818 RepID=A0A445DIU3_ARAHY|nr:hypothetical protein Ahy_A04g020818 [Arachis hypogaea]
MANNSVYIVVCVYPKCRMRNGDNGVTFECENLILLRTHRVSTLSELKSLILSNLGGTEAREVGRVGYRFLAPMELSTEVGYIGRGGSVHSIYVNDDRPLAPPPIHVTIPVDEAKEGDEESDEEYVVDSTDSDSFEGGDEEEFVPERPAHNVPHHVLPPPYPILALSTVPSHYHTLDLDAMHEKTLFSDMGEEDYNLDFWSHDDESVKVHQCITYERLQKLFVTKGREAQSQMAAGNYFSQRLMAAIEKMRVTDCDRRASVFVVKELKPFEGWLQGLFHVRLSAGTCDCDLFQSLHYPCRHALARCAAASIEWDPYAHPVYR